MTAFSRKAFTAMAALSAFASSQAAQAGPYIIATSVAPICKIEADGSVSTVAVTLNTTTANFYGNGLYYHFKAANGAVTSFPSPGGSPRNFAVPANTYALYITTNASFTFAGASSSAAYPITVAPPQIVTMRNGRKMCVIARPLDGVRNEAIKKL